MRLTIFGLTVSSSWGNGHATLWRGLIRALARAGHHVTFVERDQPWYAPHRDLTELPGGRLLLYRDWAEVLAERRRLLDADALFVTSYCPDAGAATALLAEAPAAAARIFYDLDTPVTLARLAAGEAVDYLPAGGLGGFDLALSYTGGEALTALERLGATRTAPLYGHVDPETHRPAPAQPWCAGDLSYLGTYAADRQATVERLFVRAAEAAPERRFVLGGSSYPADFPWAPNIYYMNHVAPPDHPSFFCSSRLTLNATRADMAAMGWCPSGRLFEAAACGAAILSDSWPGLDHFFRPGEEILLAADTADALAALELSDAELGRIARAARERVLAEHSSAARAAELVRLIEGLSARPAAAA